MIVTLCRSCYKRSEGSHVVCPRCKSTDVFLNDETTHEQVKPPKADKTRKFIMRRYQKRC